MKFSELDYVKVLITFPEERISEGEKGTIVHAFTHPNEACVSCA